MRNAADLAVRWLFAAAFLRSAGVGLCGALPGVRLATAVLRRWIPAAGRTRRFA